MWTKAASGCESHAAGFFTSLDQFGGAIHLVFGEQDHFDPEGLRHHAIARVSALGHQVTVLPGQDHSSWDYDVTQGVYELDRKFLRKHLA